MITIEKLFPEDVSRLVPLVRDYWAFEGITEFDESKAAGLMADLLADASRGLVLAAKNDADIVGYLVGVYVFSLEYGGLISELDELYVDPGYRGKRVGYLLVSAAETHAIREKCKCISLQISRSNAAAKSFYLANGFSDRAGFEFMVKQL